MTSPIPPFTQATLFAAFMALLQGSAIGAYTFTQDCNDEGSVIDGDCADLTSEILQVVGLGIIPGAPLTVNLLFGAFGVAQRLTILVWIIEQGPWMLLVAGILAVLTALVAWLA